MSIKYIIIFLLPIFSFSQNKINVSGKIKSSNSILNEVLIELKLNKTSKFAVSNLNGDYRFNAINCNLNDTLFIKVNYIGYIPIFKSLIINQEEMIFDIELEKIKAEPLSEVIIKSKSTEYNAEKYSYKINQKDYIKNAKATDVLKKVPNVFFNEINGAIVDGTLKGRIFIDGIEAFGNEIKNIRATEVDRVEVINNPSAIYGTDFLGAIINIITKKTNKEFFKGSISTSGGVQNNEWLINPVIEYKKGFFSIKTEMSYSQLVQIGTDKLTRNSIDGFYNQNSKSNSRIIQNYFNSILNFNLSKKSDLTVKGYTGGYNINGNLIGSANLNNDITAYSNKDESNNSNIEVVSIYKYNFSDKTILFYKNLFEITTDSYLSIYENQTLTNFDVESTRRSFAFNISLQNKDIKIFKKQSNINYDLKYIGRKFSFFDNDFYLKQNIFNATTDLSIKWSSKFSSQFALTYENTVNKNDTFSKNYILLLPTINALYRFKSKIKLKLGFSQKILRPGANDLNNQLIITSPGIASQGNSNLEQQKRTYSFLSVAKEFENDNLSFKLFKTSVNNLITNVYKINGDLLVRTLDNASKFDAVGVNLSYNTKLLNKIDFNLENGMTYNSFESYDVLAIIKKNSGTSFNSSISISSNLFKDKVSVSFSGDYNAPNYTLLSKRISYPFLDFDVSTNFFKDKISLSLYIRNLLGNNATIIRDKSYSENFLQTSETRNNFTNVLLTITYNFGKYFENNIQEVDINNDDVRK